MKEYLSSTDIIDWENPSVHAKAQEIAGGFADDEIIAGACFRFVRDKIKHSWDYQLNPVTCKASDVLKYQTGYCYAKSHLLAALLRANGIPAGLCYQRLTIDNDTPPFCLHGLNAVYLKKYGWYRIDPRGNKEGINAEFNPPHERLAFLLVSEGEANLPEIYPEPLPVVVKVLTESKDIFAVYRNLPDVELS